jgi:hypothetical protein
MNMRLNGELMTNEQLEQRCRHLEAELEAIRKEIRALHITPASGKSSRNSRFRGLTRSIPWLLGIALASGLVFAQTKEALFIDERGSIGIGRSEKLDGFHVVLPEGKLTAPGPGVTLSGGNEGNARLELRNNGSGTPYIDFAVDGYGNDFDARIRLLAPGKLAVEGADLGIGTTAPRARVDIQQGTREGTHPAAVEGLYVTGKFGNAQGVEFRHSNGTQGIGFGYNTIYATGGNANQDLNLRPRGTGRVNVEGEALRVTRLQIGNTTVGERELQILNRLAAGKLQVDIFNVRQGEYLYAADFAPYDKDRRRVFTWRQKTRINQGQWILRFPQ